MNISFDLDTTLLAIFVRLQHQLSLSGCFGAVCDALDNCVHDCPVCDGNDGEVIGKYSNPCGFVYLSVCLCVRVGE